MPTPFDYFDSPIYGPTFLIRLADGSEVAVSQ